MRGQNMSPNPPSSEVELLPVLPNERERVMLGPDPLRHETKVQQLSEPLLDAAEVSKWLALDKYAGHNLLGIVEVPKNSVQTEHEVVTDRETFYIFQSTKDVPLADSACNRPDNISEMTPVNTVTIVDGSSIQGLADMNRSGGEHYYDGLQNLHFTQAVLPPGRTETVGRSPEYAFSNILVEAPLSSRRHFSVHVEPTGEVSVIGHSSNGTALTHMPEKLLDRGTPALPNEKVPSTYSIGSGSEGESLNERLVSPHELHIIRSTVASLEHALNKINQDSSAIRYSGGNDTLTVAVVDGVSGSYRPQAIAAFAANILAERAAGGSYSIKNLGETLAPAYQADMADWFSDKLRDNPNYEQFARNHEERLERPAEVTFLTAAINKDTVTVATPVVSSTDRRITGDSCILLVRGNDLYSYPISDSQYFNSYEGSRPATIAASSVQMPGFAQQVEMLTFARKPGDTIIATTDALAHVLLECYEQGDYETLNGILALSQDNFPAFVNEARTRNPNSPLRDDITYIKITDGEPATLSAKNGSNVQNRYSRPLETIGTKKLAPM